VEDRSRPKLVPEAAAQAAIKAGGEK